MAYCAKCGGIGILPNGKQCECAKQIKDVYTEVFCLEIPEQYRELIFDKSLVTPIKGDSYAKELESIHNDIAELNWHTKNYVLCSPPRHSKTIMAYSCIRRLFRSGIMVSPIYDLIEVKSYLMKPITGNAEAETMLNAPYLFVKIPTLLSQDILQAGITLLDRRVRHNHSTIFLYNGSWKQLYFLDKYKDFTPYQGDGSYSSFYVSSWEEVEKQ